MNSLSPNGQNNSPTKNSAAARGTLVVIGVVILAAAAWFFWPRGDAQADGENAAAPSGSAPAPDAVADAPRPASTRRPLVVKLDDEPPAAPKPRVVLPEVTVAELETRFRAERETDARKDIAAEIAGHNDAVAVAAIARLFKNERHPAVKEALLAGLADIDAEAAPAARRAVLGDAIRGQPRNVRMTAIDLLAHSDDPREIALLAKAAVEDPDNEIRETARVILDAANAARAGDGR